MCPRCNPDKNCDDDEDGDDHNDHANGENYDDDDVDDCIQGGESPCQFTGYAFLWMAGIAQDLYTHICSPFNTYFITLLYFTFSTSMEIISDQC